MKETSPEYILVMLLVCCLFFLVVWISGKIER